MIKYYAVKSATVRKAGTTQKEVLVIKLDGVSFGEAQSLEKLAKPGPVIAGVGISTKGNYVFAFKGKLYIRYLRYELTGNESCYVRAKPEREKRITWARAAYPGASEKEIRRHAQCMSMHLWSGPIAWGGRGKFALKPFTGEFRVNSKAPVYYK